MSVLLLVRSADDVRSAANAASEYLAYRRQHVPAPPEANEVLGIWLRRELEMFVTRGGDLIVNEIAPRTHNSGHYRFGACAASQFEQRVRAIGGLPLGDPSLLRPAVMLNLLGDLGSHGSPAWSAPLTHPAARLHLYGKSRALPGRKVGHILVLGEDADEAGGAAESIASELERGMGQPGEPAWTS